MNDDQTTLHIQRKHPRTFRRMAGVALPAAIVTVGLFSAMQNFIHVDDFHAQELRTYSLEAYVQPVVKEDPLVPERKPIRREPVKPPPLPDKLVKSVHNMKLPVSGYEGVAPANYGPKVDININPTRATSVMDRTIQPISPPVPVYPRDAATKGITGACEIHLSVSPQGDPFDIRARCTDRIFKRAAEKAVRKVRFAPKIHDGLPVTVTGVVYPIEFKMDQ